MFYVNVVSLDYLTISTYNPVIVGMARKVVAASAKRTDADKKRMQYTGELFHNEEGTAFIGSGDQGGTEHHLIQVSGLMADTLFPIFAHPLKTGKAKCTRIDLQITVEYDRESWSQSDLFDVLRSRNPGRSVSYVESQSGPAGSKLATVYFGSRKSDRFLRIYEKMGLGEDVYLRFEVEYKGARANTVASWIDEKGPKPILANEIARTGYKLIADTFAIPGPVFNPKLIKPEPQTLKWLREQVAPALDRVLNDHNVNSDEIADLFRRILDDSA